MPSNADGIGNLGPAHACSAFGASRCSPRPPSLCNPSGGFVYFYTLRCLTSTLPPSLPPSLPFPLSSALFPSPLVAPFTLAIASRMLLAYWKHSLSTGLKTGGRGGADMCGRIDQAKQQWRLRRRKAGTDVSAETARAQWLPKDILASDADQREFISAGAAAGLAVFTVLIALYLLYYLPCCYCIICPALNAPTALY